MISSHCFTGYGIAYGLRQKVTTVLIVRESVQGRLTCPCVLGELSGIWEEKNNLWHPG